MLNLIIQISLVVYRLRFGGYINSQNLPTSVTKACTVIYGKPRFIVVVGFHFSA